MANHAFLQQVGVYTIPTFMTQEDCAQWRSVATASGGQEAQVYGDRKRVTDENVRKTLTISMDEAVRAALEIRIRTLQPDLERYFGVQLDGLEQPHCLMYRPGDFFKLHSDTRELSEDDDSHYAKTMRRRVVTVLVFLNEPGHDSEPYDGGVLTLYGLMSGAASSNFGFPVEVETGLLIAFRATTLHEVSPVAAGRRYTLVTWFLAPEPQRNGDDHHD
jgi:predicted 2-oxoglutarate/Fe(II)-dependent dioxygenase YbiX